MQPDFTELPGVEDSAEFTSNMAIFTQRYQEVMARLVEAQAEDEHPLHADPLNVVPAFRDLATQMATNPTAMWDATLKLWTAQGELMRRMMMGAPGQEDHAPVAAPKKGDKRFSDDEWSSNLVFDYIKQAYLLNSDWVQSVAHDTGDMSERDRRKVDFYTRNFVEAMSPTNFAATNPAVIRETIAQKGGNLVKGVKALSRDVERGKGQLIISQTDMDAFEVGRDMAVTPGKVIWRTPITELIQYSPTTEKVYAKPLFIVPPWINKYYILDLNEQKSLVKWLVAQGFTVFILSWVNPGPEQSDETWESYMENTSAAIDVVLAETGQKSVNIVGYCAGGALVSTMLCHMANTGDKRVSSATLFTAQVEYTNAGELQVFVDEETVKVVDEQMDKGYLPASSMANAFNLLRSSDLIWNYVISNYMLGKEPFPFDMLYWNADSTSMPAQVHHFFLEQLYNRNMLAKGTMEVFGEKLDLADIKIPVYHVAPREDHIAPAASVYRGAKLMENAKHTFVVSGSGHIAGIVNAPQLGKYQ
ncbi:MAG: alpha/beta fold hydrolase, partial [Pseudomonadota bacterium]